ncbi:hypothetical protein EYZ11_008511 [Aspergillus tanneri]|uniref:Cytochrome P450 n=1 Tax=Aspergillus tanneri TaxID=1220188 RepID=A0A4S3JAL0_9EURO|nr:hypothetical protein EYZ11_008511 [Aspergillus tanneri]
MSTAVPEAGAETTASTLTVMIRYLAIFPESQTAAHHEVIRVFGNNRTTTLDREHHMPYISALIKETLPLCPVATTVLCRMAGANIKYQDHTIPKGTILLANINHPHWDPARFEEHFKLDQSSTWTTHTGPLYMPQAQTSGHVYIFPETNC